MEASLLIVEARMKINLIAMTIEQVVEKRKKVFGDMCNNLEMQTREYFVTLPEESKSKVQELLHKVGILAAGQSVKKYIEVKFRDLLEQTPEIFNNDAVFKRNTNAA